MNTNGHFTSLAFPVLCILIMAPIYVFFAIAGDAGRGRAAAIAAGDVVAIARLSWDQRGKWWYWVVLVLLSLGHIFAVETYEWSGERLLWISLLPIAALDIFVGYGLIWILQKTAAFIGR